MLAQAFTEQLLACLDECARGRKGCFPMSLCWAMRPKFTTGRGGRLRELALALQGVLTQQEQRNALCDEFLDLCSIHGESNPGERRLARAFLERIERGEVGIKPNKEGKPW